MSFKGFVFFGRSVFWALFAAIYLCFGMPEVYRVLFEVFGMDPEAEDCQPKLRRQLEDIDYVSVEFEGNKLSWQDVATYKVSLLFLCVFVFSVLPSIKNTQDIAPEILLRRVRVSNAIIMFIHPSPSMRVRNNFQ